MLEKYIRCPIGLQNFEHIRTLGCVYVGKTEQVYRLTHTDRVYFLSRPRRAHFDVRNRDAFKAVT